MSDTSKTTITRTAEKRILDCALRMYPSRVERAAMRGALGDAAGLCDAIAREIEQSNTVRGRVIKAGQEAAAIAKLCADTIWEMRNKVQVPHV